MTPSNQQPDCVHCGHDHPAYSPCVSPPAWEDTYNFQTGEWEDATKFAPPPEGYEAIMDDDGEDAGYRREIATGTIVTIGDEE